MHLGGGLTGVSVAYWLTELGVKGDSILLLEGRDALGAGATGRNGGHCWPSTRVWPEKGMHYGPIFHILTSMHPIIFVLTVMASMKSCQTLGRGKYAQRRSVEV